MPVLGCSPRPHRLDDGLSCGFYRLDASLSSSYIEPACVVLGSPILIVVSVICRDQCIYTIRNTDNICTDLYILMKPQSKLGYLGCGLSNYFKSKNRSCCNLMFTDLLKVVETTCITLVDN